MVLVKKQSLLNYKNPHPADRTDGISLENTQKAIFREFLKIAGREMGRNRIETR